MNVEHRAPPGERRGLESLLGRAPVLTLAVLLASVGLERVPALAERLSLERGAVGHGELWRLLTGHLVHGSARLAFADLGAFLVLGVLVERRSRKVLGLTLLASASLGSLAVLLFTDFERYVGSSALGCGLLVAFLFDALGSPDRGIARPVAAAVLVLFLGKLVLELTGSWPAAWSAAPAGVATAGPAHLGGVLGGALGFLLSGRPRPVAAT